MRDALGDVQSVLVLGGNSDIAAATLRKLVARRTRTVVLAGRDAAGLQALATELEGLGAARAEAVAFDATEVKTHEAFVDDVFDRFGDFDLILLAFGLLGDQEQAERDTAHALAVVETNFVGAVSVGLPVARRLRAQGHGVLAVLSTVAAERPRRPNFIYGASKAGLDAFAQGLSDSLVGTGASVLVVRPGFVRTKMTAGRQPAPFSTTPEVVADQILAGLGSGAHTVWAPPQLRWLMAVLRHLPRPVFRRISAAE